VGLIYLSLSNTLWLQVEAVVLAVELKLVVEEEELEVIVQLQDMQLVQPLLYQ
jgi:hypothetical protein